MEAMSTHITVHVLENGNFLRSNTLTSPTEIDANLLQIKAVQELRTF